MSFTKVQIIHMVVEAVIIGAVSVYLITKMNRLNSRVDNLENALAQERQKTQILEAVLQEVVRFQPEECRKRVSLRVQQIKQNAPENPIINQQQQPQQQSQQQQPQQQQPQPPRANPLESIMSMMAPMMSSMIVGEPDEVEITEEEVVREPVQDEELAQELSELKEKDEQDVSNEEVNDTSETDNSTDEVEKEQHVETEDESDLLEQDEDETPKGVIDA
jgi:hypothetical protein